MFEIRLDDIYICHDDTSGYVIMADMSKIFKMKLSKQINSDNVSYKYVKNKLRKNKFLPINYVRVFMEFAAIAGHYTPVQDIMQNCFLDKTCAKPCILSYGDCIDTNSPFKEKGNQIYDYSLQDKSPYIHIFQKTTRPHNKNKQHSKSGIFKKDNSYKNINKKFKETRQRMKFVYKKPMKLKDFLLKKYISNNKSRYLFHSISTTFYDYVKQLQTKNGYNAYEKLIKTIVKNPADIKQNKVNFLYYILRNKLISNDLKININAYHRMNKFIPSQKNEFCYKQFYDAKKICYYDITEQDFFTNISYSLMQMFAMIELCGKKYEQIIIKYLGRRYKSNSIWRALIIEWKVVD